MAMPILEVVKRENEKIYDVIQDGKILLTGNKAICDAFVDKKVKAFEADVLAEINAREAASMKTANDAEREAQQAEYAIRVKQEAQDRIDRAEDLKEKAEVLKENAKPDLKVQIEAVLSNLENLISQAKAEL